LSTGPVLLPLEMKKHAAQGAAVKAEAAALLIAAEASLAQGAVPAPVLALALPEEMVVEITTAEEMTVVVAVNPLANKFGVMVTGNATTAAPTTLLHVTHALNAENPKRVAAAAIEAMAVAIVMEEVIVTEVAVIAMEEVVEATAEATEVVTEATVAATAEVVAAVTVMAVVVIVMVAVVIVMEAVVTAMEVAVIVMEVVAVAAAVMEIALPALLQSSGLVIGIVASAKGIISLPRPHASVAKHPSLKHVAVLPNTVIHPFIHPFSE
jgi:hypothetical protein